MPTLRVHKDFQRVLNLPFCYLCGNEFAKGEAVNRDHVPPKTAFDKRDRQPVLKLKTHTSCNSALSVDDKKVGQLIELLWGKRLRPARDMALRLSYYSAIGIAVENLNVDAAVWRWVKGFHAALYGQPVLCDTYTLVTPFPRGDKTTAGIQVRPIRQQHLNAVETIKNNRAFGNLDTVVANNGKLRYESVWCQADDGVPWLCCFALDIYDWKDLGSHTDEIPSRGCAGMYIQPNRNAPADAARARESLIVFPNVDTLDPFAP